MALGWKRGLKLKAKLFFSLGKGMCKRRLWKWASLSMGVLSGEPEAWGHLYQGLREMGKRRLWKWSISLCAGTL
jgi:hypothetical protein